jgi:hypothetical protein
VHAGFPIWLEKVASIVTKNMGGVQPISIPRWGYARPVAGKSFFGGIAFTP